MKNVLFGKTAFIYKYLFSMLREDARGVAGATPKFQILLYKMVLKWISKKFLYTAGYPNLKFLTSSLCIIPVDTYVLK